MNRDGYLRLNANLDALTARAQLEAVGALARRSEAIGIKRDSLDGYLKGTDMEMGRSVAETTSELAAKPLLTALDAAGEAVLSDKAEEQATLASLAWEVLLVRDRAQSLFTAVHRWESVTHREPKLTTQLAAALEAWDHSGRRGTRLLTGLNESRRRERDFLDSDEQGRSWWFTARADCDQIFAALAGLAKVPAAHLATCPACQGDFARSAGVERPLDFHVSSEQLWRVVEGVLSDDERSVMERHVARCTDCRQALELAALHDGEPEEPPRRAAKTPRPREDGDSVVLDGWRARGIHAVVRRERGHLLLRVEPQSGKQLGAVAVAMLPAETAVRPRIVPTGIEFDLGKGDPGLRFRLSVRSKTGADHHDEYEL